ncbi:MAG TPA: hypothetical protein VH601_05005 [Bryobacteraceae bacterium]
MPILFTALVPALALAHPCASCHPKEVEGFAKTAMAHSISLAGSQPEGVFEHTFSGTRFAIANDASGVRQSLERQGESETLHVQYAIGSGSHAFGYLAQIGSYLFQSPISYYTSRQAWDVAPGYEQSPNPDFSRPVTVECLTCHSDKPRPVADTLNSFESPPFAELGIQCDRCHGSAESHLRKPVPGSIVNPAKLHPAARDSICEQCHLAGEVRIPNPGRSIADFRPGERIEDVYTVYVAPHEAEKSIKVISQVEQLALSVCARSSGGKLWCGTCHNPHETPVRPAEYFRERCLVCHAKTLSVSHSAPGRDCVACHMPRRPAKDGGHTSFTDHRITRLPEAEGEAVSNDRLVAWREPDISVRQRNLALALVTAGMENRRPNQVILGYRMLNRLDKDLSGDAAALTVLGNVLLTGKQPAEAERRFERALALRPNFAPYEVNLAGALLAAGDAAKAIGHLERAVELDPLLLQAVQLLSQTYRQQGQPVKADELVARYRTAMGISTKRK